MILKCLSSGSIGNCYLLEADNEVLILDCGIPIKDIKIGLDFDLSKVVGVCVSHAHLDHSKSVNDFRKIGVPVWQPYLEEKKILKHGFGNFTVQSFDLPHNGTENRGFLIEVNGQRILYMTDFEYCHYNFKNLNVNHVLVECNYQSELVNRDLPNYEHKIRGHCSSKTCKDFIKANATDSLQTILLLHLGRETSEPRECIAEVQKVAKCPVYVAEKGVCVKLMKGDECPF